MATISDEKFMEIVDQIMTVGGEWKISMSKDGTFLTYADETHCIAEKHADAMFECIQRKCF